MACINWLITSYISDIPEETCSYKSPTASAGQAESDDGTGRGRRRDAVPVGSTRGAETAEDRLITQTDTRYMS